MKVNALLVFTAFFVVVLFSYSPANAQGEDKTKETVSKTKEVVAEPAAKSAEPQTKHAVVVTDALANAADNKGKAAAPAAAKATSKSFGGNTLSVTDNLVGETYEGGKWLTITNWDGTKWVSKRQWFPNKKP